MLHPARVMSLAVEALANGGVRRSTIGVDWDISERCERPRAVEVYGRPCDEGLKYYEWEPGKAHSLVVDLTVRCRQCGPCLRMRARLWAARCMAELGTASRTWFGTLTLSPEWHYRASVIAGSIDFKARHRVITRWITLYLKRVRKESGARFRYCIVAEAHKSGLPHYHVLLHEPDAGNVVRFRTLQSQWSHGFSNWKLADTEGVDPRLPWYLAKYLAKSSLARVRASKDYGSPVENRRLKDGLVHRVRGPLGQPVGGSPGGGAEQRALPEAGGESCNPRKTREKVEECPRPPFVSAQSLGCEPGDVREKRGLDQRQSAVPVDPAGAVCRRARLSGAAKAFKERRERDPWGRARGGAGSIDKSRAPPAVRHRVKPWMG
jgi:hypothetical protein